MGIEDKAINSELRQSNEMPGSNNEHIERALPDYARSGEGFENDSTDSERKEYISEETKKLSADNFGTQCEDVSGEIKIRQDSFENINTIDDITSQDQLNEMLKTPEGIEKLKKINSEYQEHYEAEIRGMSDEEYREYKAACIRCDIEQDKDVDDSEILQKANEALDKFDSINDKFRGKYYQGANTQYLKDMSDTNSNCLSELKDVKNAVSNKKAEIWEKIVAMNHDDSKYDNPIRYQRLNELYSKLERMENNLDYAITKIDMNNYDISQATGVEYQDSAKKMESSAIDKTFNDAESILNNGVTDDDAILEAFRVASKLLHDVLPSLDGARREIVSLINVYNQSQINYLKEHNCTHEDAMENPDEEYARTNQTIQEMIAKSAEISKEMTYAVEKATALQEQLPIDGSDCTLRIIDNNNGRVTIERSWDNGGDAYNSHQGRFHNSDTTFYTNAVEKKDLLTLGQNSGSIYSHTFRFQYRGVEFERKDTFGVCEKKFKNVVNGGLLTFDAGYDYNRGVDGKKSSLTAKMIGSIAHLKDTVSLILKNKEYKNFSAEVSMLKASSSVQIDSSGVATASASSHILGGEAEASIGNIKVAKISGRIGEAKAMASTDIWTLGYSASMGDHKISHTAWDELEEEGITVSDNSSDGLIESKASASIGNGLDLFNAKVSTSDDKVKVSTAANQISSDVTAFVDGLQEGHIVANTNTIQGIIKDANTFQDIKEGKLGVEVTKDEGLDTKDNTTES